MAIKSSLFLVCFFLFNLNSYAQTEEEPKDTVIPKLWQLTTTEQLADTVWWALKQKTTKEFMSLVPTLSIIKETFDTLDIKENAQLIKIKYNLIIYTVGKQLKVLQKKAKSNKINFKNCEFESTKILEGKDEKGNRFAYVNIIGSKPKRKFIIKFVTLQLNGNWYLVDELKLDFPEDDPYYKPPIKMKSPVKMKVK